MKIDVSDITPDFAAFWRSAGGRDLAEQRTLWHRMYEEKHRDLFDLYYTDWARPHDLDHALLRFSKSMATIVERTARIPALLAQAPHRAAQLLRCETQDLAFVFFVGVFASNAWVSHFRGRPTALFAVERLPAVPCDEVLVAHETAHQLHERMRRGEWDGDRVAHRLFEEGFATVVSEEVVPGRSQSEYLWFEDGFDDWVADCSSTWTTTRAALFESLGPSRRDRDRFFVSGQTDPDGLPPRLGYWAGRRLVEALRHEHDLAEMIGWSAERAEQAVNETLRDF